MSIIVRLGCSSRQRGSSVAYQRASVNVEVFLAHFGFDIHESSIGSSLGVNSKSLERPVSAYNYHVCPSGLPRGSHQDPSHHSPSSLRPMPLRETSRGRRQYQTSGSPCSPWPSDLSCHSVSVSIVKTDSVFTSGCSPSSLQFLQTVGGLVGQLAA